jgi:hypothetical protein
VFPSQTPFQKGKLILAACGSVLALAFSFGNTGEAQPAAASGSRPPASVDALVPVVVELFTSEGCSSCPPADRLLADLHDKQPVKGAYIIALEEHVDYWNRLGWADPFSSADFSARQSGYAQVLGAGRVYTPQMVVDGRQEFVGSDADQARQAIASAAQRPKAKINIVTSNSRKASGNALAVAVRVESLPDESTGPLEICLAVTEDDLATNVPRGENAGRHLPHQAVVRRMQKLGEIRARPAETSSWTKEIRLDPGWNTARLRLVALLQEVRSRRIVGAAALAVPENLATP